MKKMGNNPLSGLNSLIRNTQESASDDAQYAHDAPEQINTHVTHYELLNYDALGARHEQHVHKASEDHDVPDVHHELEVYGDSEAHNALTAPDAPSKYEIPTVQDPQEESMAHKEQVVYDTHYAQSEPYEYVVQSPQETPIAHKEQLTHDAPDAQYERLAYEAPKTQGRKGQKLPRINMAFSDENLAYLHAMAGFERMSATQYVNNLINADRERRKELYAQLNALLGKERE